MFLNDWDDLEQLIADFWPRYVFGETGPGDALDGVTILLASYHNECYEGDAFVLYEKGGVLFEVNGSHCSYFGLEGQWEPEETSIEALRFRLGGNVFGCSMLYGTNLFADELRTVLDKLEGA
jgi:hypothetical protein